MVNAAGSYPADQGSTPCAPRLIGRRIRSGFEPVETVTRTHRGSNPLGGVWRALVSAPASTRKAVSGGWGFESLRARRRVKYARGWCNGSILRSERRDRGGLWRFESFPANWKRL